MLQEKQDEKASLTGFEKRSIFIPALNLAAGEGSAEIEKEGKPGRFSQWYIFPALNLTAACSRWRRAQDQEGLTRQVKTSGGVNSWISNVQSVSPGNCDVDGLGEKFAQWCVGLFVWSVLTIQTDSARQETKLMKIRLQVVFSGSSHAAETVALSKLTLSDSLLCKGKTLQHRVAENEAKGEDTMSVRLGTLHYPYLRSSQLVSCWL